MSALEQEAVSVTTIHPGRQEALEVEIPTGKRRAANLPLRRPGRRFRRLISPLVVLILWQLTHTFKLISEMKLPPPSELASTGWNLIAHPIPAYGSLQGALVISTQRFAVGFFFGAVVALMLATTAGLSRIGEAAIDPLVQGLRTIPLFGLIPVFLVMFGIGDLPKILLVALAASVPLYLNTYAGIRSIDGKLFELGRVLGLTRGELLRNVVIPGALPQALVGLRQSLGAAWLALVVAEQINANSGLGFMIIQASTFLRNDIIFVVLLVYTILGLITDWIVRRMERRALAWRPDLVAQ